MRTILLTVPFSAALVFSAIGCTTSITINEAPQACNCEAPAAAVDAWVGLWQTTYGDMTIRRAGGNLLVGSYGSSGHPIQGELDPGDPRVFKGRWRHAGTETTGRFRFQMEAEGEFRGAWTWGDSDPELEGTVWSGVLKGRD